MEKNKLNEEIDSIKYMFEYQKGVVISEQGGRQIAANIAGAKQKLKTFRQNTFSNQKIDRSRILDGAAAEVKKYLESLTPSLTKGQTYLQTVLGKVKGDGGYEGESKILYNDIDKFLTLYSSILTAANELTKNIMTYHDRANPSGTDTQAPAAGAQAPAAGAQAPAAK